MLAAVVAVTLLLFVPLVFIISISEVDADSSDFKSDEEELLFNVIDESSSLLLLLLFRGEVTGEGDSLEHCRGEVNGEDVVSS